MVRQAPAGRSVFNNLDQVTLPSTDITRSVTFYCALGFRQIIDSEGYARFECPQVESTFSVHLVDAVSLNSGVVVYFESSELDKWVALVNFEQEPADMSWGWREARLKDPDETGCVCFLAEKTPRIRRGGLSGSALALSS